MIVKSKSEAWRIANQLFPTDYQKDELLSKRAGYPVYESTSDLYKGGGAPHDARINDLGCRLEVVIDNDSFNIWIEDPTEGKTITVGYIEDSLALPSVTLQHVKEIKYTKVAAIQFCVDDVNYPVATQCVVIVLKDGTTATFSVDKISYIR